MGLHRGRADTRGRDRDRAGQGLARAGASPHLGRARLAGRGARTGLALAALALTAAGCSFNASAKTVTVIRTHTVTVTHTVTGQASTASPCTGSQLAGNFQVVPGSQGAGQVSYDLKLTNTSQTRCYVSGLPQAQLLDADKAPLPTKVVTAQPGFGQQVILAPGNTAVAEARFSPSVPGQGDSQSGRCQPPAWYLELTAPGGGSLDVQIAPPTSVCERGTLNFDVLAAG